MDPKTEIVKVGGGGVIGGEVRLKTSRNNWMVVFIWSNARTGYYYLRIF